MGLGVPVRMGAVRYLLVVRTTTRVMMRMKMSRNTASPAMMPISSVSLVGFITSPGPWCRAGVRAQPRPADSSPAPHRAGALSLCPLPSPTHNDSQAQLHQLSQDLRVRLYEPAEESGGMSGWAGPGAWQCPCTAPAPAHTRSAD